MGLILSAVGLGRFVSEPLGGALSDRFGAAATMQLSLAGGGATVLLGFASAGVYVQLTDQIQARRAQNAES